MMEAFYLLAAFLIPLLPAYILYKTLPSRTTVSGPFKGLDISLTGAFGGYFLLVLIAFGYVFFALRPSEPTYEVWRVEGEVEVKTIDPDTGEGSNDVVGTVIRITPPRYTIGSGGRFDMTIMVMPGIVKGQRVFPTLEFNRPGYARVVLPLNRARADFDEQGKTITLKDRVVLSYLEETTEKPAWKR